MPRLAPTPAVPIPEVTTEVYKRNVARQIYRANSDQLFEGPLPPLLKAVIVLNVHVDSRGQPVRITVMRSNGMRTLEAIATQSVRNAAPLPAPGRLLQRGYAEIVETWLFRADNRFQVRSLAERQLNE